MWRIYYDNDLTFSATDGPPLAAPAWGVQVIVQDCPDEGKHLLSNFDYYWFDTARWCGGDFLGLIDFLSLHIGVVRFGRRIAPTLFEKILARAVTDSDFVGGGVWRVEGVVSSPSPQGR